MSAAAIEREEIGKVTRVLITARYVEAVYYKKDNKELSDLLVNNPLIKKYYKKRIDISYMYRGRDRYSERSLAAKRQEVAAGKMRCTANTYNISDFLARVLNIPTTIPAIDIQEILPLINEKALNNYIKKYIFSAFAAAQEEFNIYIKINLKRNKVYEEIIWPACPQIHSNDLIAATYFVTAPFGANNYTICINRSHWYNDEDRDDLYRTITRSRQRNFYTSTCTKFAAYYIKEMPFNEEIVRDIIFNLSSDYCILGDCLKGPIKETSLYGFVNKLNINYSNSFGYNACNLNIILNEKNIKNFMKKRLKNNIAPYTKHYRGCYNILIDFSAYVVYEAFLYFSHCRHVHQDIKNSKIRTFTSRSPFQWNKREHSDYDSRCSQEFPLSVFNIIISSPTKDFKNLEYYYNSLIKEIHKVVSLDQLRMLSFSKFVTEKHNRTKYKNAITLYESLLSYLEEKLPQQQPCESC